VCCELDEKAAQALAAALRAEGGCSLTALDIEDNRLRTGGWAPLIAALGSNSTLRTLGLSNTASGSYSGFGNMSHFVDGMLAPKERNARKLNTSYKTREERDQRWVACMDAVLPEWVTAPLGANRTLTELDISDCDFEPCDWRALVAGLKANTHLQSLVLSQVEALSIDSPMLRELVAAVKSHPTIRTVHMQWVHRVDDRFNRYREDDDNRTDSNLSKDARATLLAELVEGKLPEGWTSNATYHAMRRRREKRDDH
jgi:hypothetical protein